MKSDRDVFDTSWFTRNALLKRKKEKLYGSTIRVKPQLKSIREWATFKQVKKAKKTRATSKNKEIIDNDEIMHCTRS